jgi:hypothetical protein
VCRNVRLHGFLCPGVDRKLDAEQILQKGEGISRWVDVMRRKVMQLQPCEEQFIFSSALVSYDLVEIHVTLYFFFILTF